MRVYPENLELDKTVRRLCREPYPGHPKGCPNWNKKAGCPPQAPFLYNVIDRYQPIYVVWNRFDLGAHVARLKKAHPKWSPRQLTCCLYWQGTARKELRQKVLDEIADLDLCAYSRSVEILYCPEACGLNVTATMKNIGIDLEWPPKRYAFQVALIGYPRSPRSYR
jgi:predicted metal-binding protein